VADALDVPTSSKHPMARAYPKKAFLQPALFVYRPDGTLVHAWRQTPGLLNVYGAAGRPSGADTLRIAEAAVRQR
jgi:hypothetical protein